MANYVVSMYYPSSETTYSFRVPESKVNDFCTRAENDGQQDIMIHYLNDHTDYGTGLEMASDNPVWAWR